MNLDQLQTKLDLLLEKLKQMETEEMEKITSRRVSADMGDDYRENEGAKHIMEQHDIWYIRKVALKKEIANLRVQIVKLKSV